MLSRVDLEVESRAATVVGSVGGAGGESKGAPGYHRSRPPSRAGKRVGSGGPKEDRCGVYPVRRSAIHAKARNRKHLGREGKVWSG